MSSYAAALHVYARQAMPKTHIVHYNSPLGGSSFFCGSVFSPPYASLPDASDIAPFSLNAQQKGFSNTHSFWKPDWSLNSADTFASLKLVSRRKSVHNAASYKLAPHQNSVHKLGSIQLVVLAVTNRRPLFFSISAL